MSDFHKPLEVRAIGFCGADDSVSPGLMQLLSAKYNWIEWGVLFRPDLEGTPRYATRAWVEELDKVNKATGSNMRLAAHLCQMRCQQVIEGDASFVKELEGLGFGRVQVNATTANGVDMNPSRFGEYASQLRSTIEAVPGVEFIFQLNAETQPVFDIISLKPPLNMSVLHDASCGLGIEITSLPAPSGPIPCGYAGGIGPANIGKILSMVCELDQPHEKKVWIDMESSLRVTRSDKVVTNQDCFSIDKCFGCVEVCVAMGLPVAS